MESNYPRAFSFTLAVYLPIVPELLLLFVSTGASKILSYWTLDVTKGEDACRIRSLHAPHNLALLRRFAVNTLNRESTFKRSLKQKSKRAAMDDAYMLTLLAAALPEPNQELQPICQ